MVCSVDSQESLALRGEALLYFSGRLSTTARIFDRRPLIDWNLEAMKIVAQRRRMTRTTGTGTKVCFEFLWPRCNGLEHGCVEARQEPG